MEKSAWLLFNYVLQTQNMVIFFPKGKKDYSKGNKLHRRLNLTLASLTDGKTGKNRFLRFRLATKLNKKMVKFKHALGMAAENIMKSFGLTPDQSKTFNESHKLRTQNPLLLLSSSH